MFDSQAVSSRRVSGVYDDYNYGRAESARQRRTRQRRAAPYQNVARATRRQSFIQVVGDKLNNMRQWFFGSDDTDANVVTGAPADAAGTYPTWQSERSTRYAPGATEPPSVPSPPPPPSSSSIGSKKWKGRTIDSLTFGELRGACRELDVLVSTDRGEMEKRVFGALERKELAKKEASQNSTSKRRLGEPNLDVVMKKKARTGFSVAEYDRYLQLMRDNLIEEDATTLSRLRSAGADHTSAQLTRHHTNTSASSIDHHVSKITSGRSQRRVSSSWRSTSRSRPSLSTAVSPSQSNSLNLTFRPQTASSRIPKPQLSSEAAKRHLATLHSLSSPLISSAGVQSRSIRRRPVSPLRAPGTARAFPAPSSEPEPAPAPSPAATPERTLHRPPRKTQEPLLTPIAPRDQQRPSVVPRQTPVQQSNASSYDFKLPPVSTTDVTSSISLADLPTKIEASDEAVVDASLITKVRDSRVDRTPKRSRRVEADDSKHDVVAPPTPVSEFKFEPPSDSKAIQFELPAATAADAVTASKEETSLQASVAEKEKAQSPVNELQAAQAPFAGAGSAPPQDSLPKEEECSVCGMGIDDVDHTECKEEDKSSSTPSTQEKPAFSFGAMPPLSSGGPSFSFGGEPESAASGAATSSFDAPAPVPETAVPTFSFGAPTEKPKFALPMPPVPRGEGASAPKPSGSEAAVSSTAPSAGTGFKFGAPSESTFSLTDSSAAATTATAATTAAASAPTISLGGISSSASSAPSSTPSFSFGNPPSTSAVSSTTAAPASAPAFSFGNPPSTTSTPASAPAFSFGNMSSASALSSTTSAAASAPAFSFETQPSSAPAPSSTPAFSFGNPPPTSVASTSASATAFSFGGTPSTTASAGVFSFGDSSTPAQGSAAAAAPTFSFSNTTNAFQSSETKATGFGSTPDSSAAFSFGNPPASAAASGSGSTGFSFSNQSTSLAPSTNTGFSFSTPSTGSMSNAAPATGFSFQNASAPAFGGFGTASSGSVFGQSDSRPMGFDSGFDASSDAMDSRMSPAVSPFASSTAMNNATGFQFNSLPAAAMSMPAAAMSMPAAAMSMPAAAMSMPAAAASAAPQAQSTGFNFDAPPPAMRNVGFSAGAAPAPSGRRVVRAKRRVRK